MFSAVFFASVLASCARPETGQRKEILRVWDFKYGEAEMGDAMRIYDRAFEESHPSIRVEHRGISDVDDEAVLSSAIAANAAPDVVMVHAGMEFHAFKGHFLAIDDAAAPYAPRVLPSALAACRDDDGRLRAIPLTVQGLGWYYNKRLLARVGLDPERPPRRWADFLAACSRLEAAGIKPIAWGNNPPHGSDWLRRSLAATFFDDREHAAFWASPESAHEGRFVLIASMIAELRDAGYLDSDGAFRDHIRDAARQFASGEAAMYLGLLSDISNWKEFSDALGSDSVGFFASIDHPSARNGGRMCVQSAGIVYAVMDTSANAAAAKEYAAGYLADAAAALIVEKTGALVPLAGWRYPVEKYPVLDSILAARKNSGEDPELHYPGLFIKEALFRFDELYYNTKEISRSTYLSSLEDAFRARNTRSGRNSRN